MIFYITKNKSEIDIARKVLGNVTQFIIELPTIQENNWQEILKIKAREIFEFRSPPFMITYPMIEIASLNGNPGALTEYYFQIRTLNEFLDSIKKLANNYAKFKIGIAYFESKEKIKFFESAVIGKIEGFDNPKNWLDLFIAQNTNKPYSKLEYIEKLEFDPYIQGFNLLNHYLNLKNIE